MSSSEQDHSEEVNHDNPWSSPRDGPDWGEGDGVTGWDAIDSTSDEDPAAQDVTFSFSTQAGKFYSKDMCQKALRAEDIPTAAADGNISSLSHAVNLCILRGIRHHHGFGAELLRHAGSEFTSIRRALNARAIMSNVIPDMDMRYHVGRACAVAGYSRLYKELNLLPDISIAEEARDSVMRAQSGVLGDPDGSAEILREIVQQPVRFHAMNDYRRTVEVDNPLPARHGLNGDTAVFSTLQLKRSFELIRRDWNRFCDDHFKPPCKAPMQIEDKLAPSYFNITEDWNIDEYTSMTERSSEDITKGPKRPQSEAMLEVLWSPLPFDLPWGDKDLLILMAAYHGNVDRYARLRRPEHVSYAERRCLVRGIYHHTDFARWCSVHLIEDRETYNYVRSAITARFIMSNDLSRIPEDDDSHNTDQNDKNGDDDLPIQIWYPTLAAPATYRELALRKPSKMMDAVARALIIGDYQDVWDELVDQIEPYAQLVSEANASSNGAYYLDSLRQSCCRRMTCMMDFGGVDVSAVELFIAAPKEARPPDGFEKVDLVHMYQERRAGGEESRAYRRRGEHGPRRGRGGLRGG
ncbi:hypothetical protein V8F33_012908 [Rhypophila sp. PSN 637]